MTQEQFDAAIKADNKADDALSWVAAGAIASVCILIFGAPGATCMVYWVYIWLRDRHRAKKAWNEYYSTSPLGKVTIAQKIAEPICATCHMGSGMHYFGCPVFIAEQSLQNVDPFRNRNLS